VCPVAAHYIGHIRNHILILPPRKDEGAETKNSQSSTWKLSQQRGEKSTTVKDYVSTGRTLTTRNLAARCTGTAMSSG
jgi:hypothetical protein